jgi:peptidoglycan hydrolase CwlO-like protein
MRLLGISLLALSSLVAVSAAQEGQATFADVIKEMLATMDKITGHLSGIMDEETAKAARPELVKAAAGWKDIRDKAAKMKPPTQEEKARLEKEYKQKLRVAQKKLFAEIARVKGVPGGRDALREISAALGKK